MHEPDYLIETQEEFLEDFGKQGLSDEELNNVLIKARKNGDVELRILVKELQYARFLLKNLVEYVVDPNENNDLPTIQKLAKNYAKATAKTNK